MNSPSNIKHMIFSLEKYNSIYFRIPKVASTSIMIALREVIELRDLNYFKEKYDPTYFKFAFVRNPFDRLVSSFKHIIQKGALKNINDDPLLYRGMTFKAFVGRINQIKECDLDIHFKPQYTYLPERPDFYGYFETLEEDFNKLCEKLDVRLDLPHKNFTQKTNYKDYYDDLSIETVKRIYKEDFEEFDYSMDL